MPKQIISNIPQKISNNPPSMIQIVLGNICRNVIVLLSILISFCWSLTKEYLHPTI